MICCLENYLELQSRRMIYTTMFLIPTGFIFKFVYAQAVLYGNSCVKTFILYHYIINRMFSIFVVFYVRQTPMTASLGLLASNVGDYFLF